MFTDEQKAVAREAAEYYERRIEMMWDDMKFELEMKLGLEPEQVHDLLEEVQ